MFCILIAKDYFMHFNKNKKGEIMPGIMDIAKVIVGNKPATDAQKAIAGYSHELYRPPLSIKNQLRTQLQVGDENNLGKITLPGDSEGLFAGWCRELNRKSQFDYFEKQPLNAVKENDEMQDIRKLQNKIAHKNWLTSVQKRMKKLGFKA